MVSNFSFYSVELVPVCKDDVVALPAKLSKQLGSMSQIAVVLRVNNTVRLIDPRTCQGWLVQFSVLFSA